MASTLRTLIARVVTDLEGVNGAGGYVYDLSDGDRVEYGVPTGESVRVPSVYIVSVDVASDTETAGLGSYHHEVEIVLDGWVGATTDDPGARLLAATDLLDDVHTALDADEHLNSGANGINITAIELSHTLVRERVRLGKFRCNLGFSYRTSAGY